MAAHRFDPSRAPARGQASSEPGASQGPDRGASKSAAKTGRVAQALARAGVASRREAERLIAEGRVALNGRALTSPAVNVGRGDVLTLDGKVVADREPARLWRYHKPPGLITSHKDPKGRPTVFEQLPPGLPRVISIGRLDLSSEGLLLLTNDGELARELELPTGGLVRRYRARAFGRTSQETLDKLKDGITVEGMAYGPIQAHLDGGQGSNVWVTIELAEGKNREVRRVLDAIHLRVNRLIRTAYGPFELGSLAPGEAVEVPPRQVKQLLAGELALEPPPATAKVRGAGPRSKPSTPLRGAANRKPGKSAATAEEKPKPAYKAGWARPKIKPKPKPGSGRKRT